MTQEDTMPGLSPDDDLPADDDTDAAISSNRWLAADQTWLHTGSHRIPRPLTVPLARPTRFRGLPPGANVVLLLLLVLAIILAAVFVLQVQHTLHGITAPLPTIVPTHTAHPTTTPHH